MEQGFGLDFGKREKMITFKEFLGLNEMSPVLVNKELSYYMEKMQFYSDDTLIRDFDILFDEKLPNRGNIVVCLYKDRSFVIIGKRTERPRDKKPGVYIFGQLDFKKVLDVSDKELFDIKDQKVLQVDGVEILRKMKTRGYGYLLYFNLIKDGFTIICDNVQFIGGKSLWKKIANESKFSNYKVYILDNGEFRKKDNELVFYDGSNIQDSEIWSSNYDKYHTLFLAKRV